MTNLLLKSFAAAAFAVLATAPLAAAPAVGPALAGVSDRETRITSPVVQFVRGHGDVLFVRDRAERWYRVQLTTGCVRSSVWLDNVSFGTDRGTGQIDTFSHAFFPREGYTCAVESIRLSAAPPQVNSRSIVTLD
jgi:hypothetical protein